MRNSAPVDELPVVAHDDCGSDGERSLWLAPPPSVELEPRGEQVWQGFVSGWRAAGAGAAEGYERLAMPTRRLLGRYRAVMGEDRLRRGRVSSTLGCRLAHPVDAVVAVLDEVVTEPGSLVPSGDLRWVDADREFRMPVVLHIPWSRPSLVMWLGVQAHVGSASTLHLALRSTHRLRYPARYFAAGHRALDEVRDRLGERLAAGPT